METFLAISPFLIWLTGFIILYSYFRYKNKVYNSKQRFDYDKKPENDGVGVALTWPVYTPFLIIFGLGYGISFLIYFLLVKPINFIVDKVFFNDQTSRDGWNWSERIEEPDM